MPEQTGYRWRKTAKALRTAGARFAAGAETRAAIAAAGVPSAFARRARHFEFVDTMLIYVGSDV